MTFDYTFKIILIGDHDTGKTTFFRTINYLDLSFIPTTIGVDFFTKYIKKENRTIKVNFWDTAGQERFRSIVVSYFKNISGILLFFNLNNINTFISLENWLKDIKNNNSCDHEHPIILIGNKSDLKKNVDSDSIKILVNKYNLIYREISVLNDDLNDIFDEIIDLIYSRFIINNIQCRGVNNYHDYKNNILTKKDNIQIKISKKKENKCCIIN